MGKNVAIVLSAGQGKRMRSSKAKQYLLIGGKPVVCYSLQAFQNSPLIDEIVLVTGEQDIPYCEKEIVAEYGFSKVTKVVAGGKERYHSVYLGLKAAGGCDYVYIHDGARPFIDEALLQRADEAVRRHRACVVGMPVKDTIKISDEDGFCKDTPRRSLVWQIQTPQVFAYELILQSYERMLKELESGADIEVTDDAMVVEHTSQTKVKLVKGSYANIKITTPEDLKLAEIFAE